MNDTKETNISLKEFVGKNVSANDLLKQLNLTEPPFDPFYIASKLGLKINQESTMDNLAISGSISIKDKKVNIWINPFDVERRQKFTLAHELAHLTNDISINETTELKDYPKTLYRNGELNDRETRARETRANEFAGELLMPRERFIDEVNEIITEYGTTTESGNKTIALRDLTPKLASVFEVTEPAVFVRLKVLKIAK